MAKDRTMVRVLTYFRVRWCRLGATGTSSSSGCVPAARSCSWSASGQRDTTRVGERHVFQHGAVGGATDEEFHRGSDRVEEYLDLAYYGRFHRQLKAPPHRYPMPAPLTVGDLGSVLGQAGSYEGVQVVEEPPECRA